MIGMILSAVLIVLGVIALLSAHSMNKEIKETEEHGGDARNDKAARNVARVVGTVIVLIGVAVLGFNSFYTQDAGEVVVIRSFSGNISGSTTETGIHFKAPWTSCIRYDIRNNVISFVSDGAEDYTGGSATGKQVTVNDKSGVSANIDIQVNYSLDPTKAVDIYRDYGTQENFVRAIAAVDVRSVPREISGQFDTITMLTDRSQFTNAIETELSSRWEEYGLVIEQVSVQEIRYPESVTSKYAEAQQALIAKEKAQNEQETAKVEAETKKIEAQGEADANAILTQSLTPEVLQQRYIDALNEIGKSGNLIITDGSTDALLNIGGNN